MSQQAEISLSGVYYAIHRHGPVSLRVGSLIPDWQRLIAQYPTINPSAQASLADEGIWVQPLAEHGAVGVICCGLGSVWPGMGRVLYEEFPIAREAMEQIAAIADWDVLGLLYEPDLLKISQTRWQIPYLFLLEYAQWRLFYTLGLTPRLICGHSLGELIALCLAGVYSLESAWYLLETRAVHMAELEAKGGRAGGMLAVPAPFEIIATILNEWSSLRISNRNTHRQYILSGSRELLLKARKQLRRQHIPAVMLNMDLAFHNPAMRILRSISLRRLNGLEMHPPVFPLLSCVDAEPYPGIPAQICTRIADLDENAVDWVKLMETIQQAYPCTIFLELGPQETLCGITNELVPDLPCISADKKGHEARAIRTACARLFAGGFLDFETLIRLAASEPVLPPPTRTRPQAPADLLKDIPPEQITAITGILAQASEHPHHTIRPDMELRHDLGIRSSSFPFLMLEAERILDRPVVLENLFQITTVADLVLFLTGHEQPTARIERPEGARREGALGRYTLQEGALYPLGIDPRGNGPGLSASRIRVSLQDKTLWPGILFGLLSAGWEIDLGDQKQNVLLNELWAGTYATRREQPEASTPCMAEDGAALLIVVPGATSPGIIQIPGAPAWVCIVGLFKEDTSKSALQKWFGEIERNVETPYKAIACLSPWEGLLDKDEAGDLLALELLHGQAREVVWQTASPAGNRYCKDSPVFRQIWVEAGDRPKSHTQQWHTQFSLYGDEWPKENPLPFAPEGTIPPSRLIARITEAATLTVPWLNPVGFTDLRIFHLPQVRGGLTRECRLVSSSRIGCPYDGVMARICNVEMALAALNPNGRKTGKWDIICTCSCILAADAGHFPPIWQSCRSGPVVADRQSLDEFYDASGVGSNGRLLEAISQAGFTFEENCEAGYEAVLRPLDSPEIHATRIGMLLDAVLQGALWTLKEHGEEAAFEGIGFIRFAGLEGAGMEDLRLQWRKSWEDAELIRFDVQIADRSQAILATIHNVEFNRRNFQDGGREIDGP